MSHAATSALCRSIKLQCELYPSRQIAICLDPYCGLGFALWCLCRWTSSKIRNNIIRVKEPYRPLVEVFVVSVSTRSASLYVSGFSVYSGHQSILVPPLELESNASLWLAAVSQYKVRVTFCSYSVMEMCTKGLGSQTEALRVSLSLQLSGVSWEATDCSIFFHKISRVLFNISFFPVVLLPQWWLWLSRQRQGYSGVKHFTSPYLWADFFLQHLRLGFFTNHVCGLLSRVLLLWNFNHEISLISSKFICKFHDPLLRLRKNVTILLYIAVFLHNLHFVHTLHIFFVQVFDPTLLFSIYSCEMWTCLVCVHAWW